MCNVELCGGAWMTLILALPFVAGSFISLPRLMLTASCCLLSVTSLERHFDLTTCRLDL